MRALPERVSKTACQKSYARIRDASLLPSCRRSHATIGLHVSGSAGAIAPLHSAATLFGCWIAAGAATRGGRRCAAAIGVIQQPVPARADRRRSWPQSCSASGMGSAEIRDDCKLGADRQAAKQPRVQLRCTWTTSLSGNNRPTGTTASTSARRRPGTRSRRSAERPACNPRARSTRSASRHPTPSPAD